jgi:hypothetical protein
LVANVDEAVGADSDRLGLAGVRDAGEQADIESFAVGAEANRGEP